MLLSGSIQTRSLWSQRYVALGSLNGSASAPINNAVYVRSKGSIEEISAQVQELKIIVQQQQALLQEQAKLMKDMTQLYQRDTLPIGSNLSTDKYLTRENAQQTMDGAQGTRIRPFEAQLQAANRRMLGLYDARFHSLSYGATPRDFRVLPKYIILVRHGESEGNVDPHNYTRIPDPMIPLTAQGHEQARQAGAHIRRLVDADETPYKLHFYISPYKRSKESYYSLVENFDSEHVAGVQEEVQLREQDFGNFQDAEGKKREKAERLRFGRFFYRFPNGESGADVYDRITIFEDHLCRDINAGRFQGNTSIVLVTHGLALRIFLMRWFHWTTDQFLNVFNPPNAAPVILERIPNDYESRQGGPAAWIHTKNLYRISHQSMLHVKGCTHDMCTAQIGQVGPPEFAWSSSIDEQP